MDARFCAVCNRSSSSISSVASAASAGVDTSLDEILTLLNETKSRATNGAVAGVLGVPPRSMGTLLGERRPEASWVVNAETGLPTDCTQADWHPELLSTSSIIRTSNELTLRLTLWRAKR